MVLFLNRKLECAGEEWWRGWACGVEVDARGALGAGPGAAEVAGAREVHGTMLRLSQCWGGGGGLTLLLDGVKFMFFLWK